MKADPAECCFAARLLVDVLGNSSYSTSELAKSEYSVADLLLVLSLELL